MPIGMFLHYPIRLFFLCNRILFLYMPYQVIIFEDNTRLRQSMEILLNDDNVFHVAASFSRFDNVADQVEVFDAALVVMDIDMPGVGGIEGVKKIKQYNPDIKVVMHTVFDDDNRIFDSICAGANGYMLKNTSPVQLLRSL